MSPLAPHGTLPGATQPVEQRGARRKPRILVAEDHADTRFMLRVFLERRGLDVVEATNGEEALGLCQSTWPDLVLIDSSLPRLDGIGVTRRLRGDPRPRVPIVFLSGRAEPVAQVAAFDAGCDDYLTKPFGLDRLASVLERHLGDGPCE